MRRWKVWLPVVVLLGLAAWWTVNGLQGSLLILNDGNTLVADKAWAAGDRAFYKQGDSVKILERSSVQQIVTGSLTDPATYHPLLAAHFKNSLARLSGLKLPESLAGTHQYPLFLQSKPLLPLLAGGFLSLLLFLMGIRAWRQHRRKKGKPGGGPAGDFFLHLADFSDVETLFLNLFKKKLGAAAATPTVVEKIPKKGSTPGQILKLKVQHDGKWQSRRMSMAPIGEGTGSKSQCFYVIYDTHIVVKIPPKPITDFEDYITRLQAETKIMQRLAPKVCVIPNLAVILRKIHAFPDADDLPPAQLEDRYIRWLRKFPENQRFLTIGGSFVFFMDLARYFFLSHVADSFHGKDAGLAEEIRADIDILSDFSLFEGKYGRRGSELWPDLNKAYESFRAELNGVIAQSDEQIALSEWDIKELYLSHMAGRDTDLATLNVSVSSRAFLEKRLSQAGAAGSGIKQRYQQMLKHYYKKRLFNRSRPLMGSMVTNLLSLLAWLGTKKIGLRDLKPDNLLVAGNPHEYPHFLTSVKEYTIGLIDLETAVNFECEETARIPQPQLGGTPLYCTPSHFMPNWLLQQIYGDDLPQVFHLQDWYAIITIIFEVITGDHLFKSTSHQIPMMMKSVMQTAAAKGDLKKSFLHFARQFHDNSNVETRENFQLHSRRLQAVTANIPANIQRQLADHYRSEQIAAEQRLKQLLDNTDLFNKGNNRRRLGESSVADLEKLRASYAKRKGSKKLLGQMDTLIRYKQKTESVAALGRILAAPFPNVTAGKLLEMMFSLVHSKLLSGIALPPPGLARQIPAPGPVVGKDIEEADRLLGYSATISL